MSGALDLVTLFVLFFLYCERPGSACRVATAFPPILAVFFPPPLPPGIGFSFFSLVAGISIKEYYPLSYFFPPLLLLRNPSHRSLGQTFDFSLFQTCDAPLFLSLTVDSSSFGFAAVRGQRCFGVAFCFFSYRHISSYVFGLVQRFSNSRTFPPFIDFCRRWRLVLPGPRPPPL